MKGKLNLKLLNNSNAVYNLNRIEYLQDNNVIEFTDNKDCYRISLNEKYFIKENDEFIFNLNIENKTCTYLLKEIDNLFDINVLECSLEETKNKIKIEYKIESNEEKNIIEIELIEEV